MLRLRRHLGSSRFPDSGNVRVNILVAKRGTYGLKSLSVRRDHRHINCYAYCMNPGFRCACLLGAVVCFMETPVRTLS
ncbi:hypothetical protein EAJ18_01580 [Citrobacter amalonaticus]|uniref:Uncharacterized protein n=1 Tax=Citrobacter amalonaticus TaxID=35703 RepID=A0ABY0HZK4_CITAM|nr:hypothetical protein C2U53_24160 [Citrobacter sp. CFNIH10]AVC45240.1 hypothetical protein AL524_24965 [Citrobacter amalonaticus]PNP36436.1 hypothetical protein AL525_022580 [Citrobacter amalonaticus]RYT46389.1 hypothetical protein EAJ18_01580 [Citrobacter amalonaticus]